MLVGLFSVLITNSAAQSCLANLNLEAQFATYGDRMFTPEALQAALVYTNLTYILQRSYRI